MVGNISEFEFMFKLTARFIPVLNLEAIASKYQAVSETILHKFRSLQYNSVMSKLARHTTSSMSQDGLIYPI